VILIVGAVLGIAETESRCEEMAKGSGTMGPIVDTRWPGNVLTSAPP
jgi:hypothetical protein